MLMNKLMRRWSSLAMITNLFSSSSWTNSKDNSSI